MKQPYFEEYSLFIFFFRSGASEASGATITEFMAVPILQGFGQICAIRGLVHMHLKPTLQVFWRCQS